MTPHYPAIWKALQAVGRFEKYASESADATVDLARTCSAVFDQFLTKAASSYESDGTAGGEALRAATFAEALYDSHRAVSDKTASVDTADEAIEKLAAVVYVDTVLKAASDNMSGEQLSQTHHLRLLGREYGVELLKNLVG